MKRRKFIGQSIKGAMVPFFMGGMGLKTYASASFLPTGVCDFGDRAMVVIHLNGANDIINTFVPLNQMGQYRNVRPDIQLPQSSLTTLDNAVGDDQLLGVHPSFTAFKRLYDEGRMGLVQRVGYPSPNRSHFTSTSAMNRGITGSTVSSDSTITEGWIGRFLKDRYPAYQGLPFGNQPDPLGILLGGGNDGGYHTNSEHNYHLNLSGQDPAGFFNIISSLSGAPIDLFPNSQHGNLLEYISGIERSTQVYSERITEVFNAGSNAVSYPDSKIGNQLKTIARFLAGGSTTKVFYASTGGWDTHAAEVNIGDTTNGRHSILLKDLGDSLKAFQDDLRALGIENRVLTAVFSEFGRKIIQNESAGSDHGTLSSMFLMGGDIKPGIYGKNINLSQIDRLGAPDVDTQLTAKDGNDYRTVFSSLIQDWMGASNESVRSAFPFTSDEILFTDKSYVKPERVVDAACHFGQSMPESISIRANIFLEGFYELGNRKMHTKLAEKDLLPFAQPFIQGLNYTGNEEVASFPPDTVDWILCELRNKSTFEVVAQKAVLLKADGSLMDLDGSTTITFPDQFLQEYHLAIFHRNHLGIISTGVTNPNKDAITAFEFNNLTTVQGLNQLKKVGEDYVLLSGDLAQNGVIGATDYKDFSNRFGAEGYYTADLNGDGKVDALDRVLFMENRSKLGFPLLFPKMVTQ